MSADVTLDTPAVGTPARPAETTANALATLAGDLSSRPVRTPGQIARARFRSSKLAVFGLILIVLFTLIAVFANAIAPYGENEIDLFNITAPPSPDHLLGTDELGRDELSRLIYGSRVSLLVGVGVAIVATVIGITVGALAGYYGGKIDSILMRFVDVMLAFPGIFLLLIVFSIQGSSVATVILFLGAFFWMWLARAIRAEFFSLKKRDFMEAARAIGVPDGRLIWRHLLPNVGGTIIVSTTLDVAYAMLSEAGLSFLGFGVPPSTPTWGNMLNAAKPNYTTVPLLAIAPGLALTLAVLAINFVGDGLRDALDPRGRAGQGE
jgi:peptide/nickel transport system permease protein